ncbi:MAG: hypothetical protein P8129_19325 [Anaerolineae bacterium]
MAGGRFPQAAKWSGVILNTLVVLSLILSPVQAATASASRSAGSEPA